MQTHTNARARTRVSRALAVVVHGSAGLLWMRATLKGVTGVTVVEPDEGMFDAIETNADAGLLVIGLPLPHLDELSAIGEIMHRPHARHLSS